MSEIRSSPSANQLPVVSNAIWGATQFIVQTVALLVLYRQLITLLGIQRFGIWSVVVAVASASRFGEAGLSGSVTKFVAQYRALGDERRATAALQTAGLTVALLVGAVLAVAWMPLRYALARVLPNEALSEAQSLLPIVLVCIWVNSIGGVWLSALDGCLRTDIRARIGAVATVGFVAMAIPAAQLYGLRGLAVAQLGQALGISSAAWVAARHVMPSLPLLPRRWSRALLREMWVYGVNFQATSVAMILFEPATKMLAARFGGLAAAGQFEVAERIVFSLRAILVEANRTVVGSIAQLHAQRSDELSRLYSNNVRYLLLASTLCFTSLVALSPTLSELWLGSYQRPFVLTVIALSLAWFINTMATPAYFAYLGIGRLKWTTLSHVMMAGINLGLGVVLGTVLGSSGVIAAFCCAIVCGSALLVARYHHESKTLVSKLLSREDVILVGASLVAAVSIALTYDVLHLAATQPVRTTLCLLATVTLFGGGTLVHSLSRDLIRRLPMRLKVFAGA